MALAGFQVADIRSRGLNPPGDLLLGEIEPAAALANDGAESWLSRFSHRIPLLRPVLCRGRSEQERAG
jgi:hypothetical protein